MLFLEPSVEFSTIVDLLTYSQGFWLCYISRSISRVLGFIFRLYFEK